MLGGRLCNLTLYKCASKSGGTFGFYNVSGSGLDIVEQRSGTISITRGAIRGVSVTRDTTDTLTDSPSLIDVQVEDSLVTNVYFAEGLKGSAKFTGSVVLMLINANRSEPGQFDVAFHDCLYQFHANTRPTSQSTEGSKAEGGARLFELVDGYESIFAHLHPDRFASQLRRMDYRLHPEKLERAMSELFQKDKGIEANIEE